MRKLTMEIKQDESPFSPRENDNLGKMVFFHRDGYGDKHSYSIEEAKALYAKMQKGEGVALPVFMYSHSGVTIATKPFSCPWDSGQIGFIMADKEAIRNNFMSKRVTAKMMETALKVLQGEVEEYDKYLTGDVWGYVIKDEAGEVVDSCWGFYGREYAEQEGKAALKAEKKYKAKEEAKIDACMVL